ncbi:Transposon Tf2-6 polyprotein, partial [Araneus ventricosus]
RKALPPKTRKQVRSFLGVAGFYRRFIPNFSKIALPLTNLTKEKIKFVWTEVEQQAFETLRDCLIKEPCLKLPDLTKEFSISTDASLYSLGAVLMQTDDEGILHPVAFASRKLGPTEIRYSTCEKECMGIVFGVTQFKNYVYGTQFKIYTDQQSLSKIKKCKDPTSRIARWLLTLQQFSFTIIYQPGRLNLMADYLSRAAYKRGRDVKEEVIKEMFNIEAEFSAAELHSISITELIKNQEEDKFCKNIKSKLQSGHVFAGKTPKYFYRDNLLLCYRENSDRHSNKAKLVVPRTMIHQVLKVCHDSKSVAHAGFGRTLRHVRERFWWCRFYRDVKKYVASCHECISRRGFSKNQKAPVQRIPTANFPFEKVGIDAVGPFVTSSEGNKHLIVMTDYFSKYAEAYPVKNIQSETVCKVLMDFISRHGIMRVLYSDRGSNFISAAMQEVYELLGISKKECLSYSPQGNGAVERLNKTLVEALSHLVSFNQTDWCQQIPLALMAYRNAYHRSILEKPSFVISGRDLIMPPDLIYAEPMRSYSDTFSYKRDLVNRMHSTFALIKSSLEKAAEANSKNPAPLPNNKRIEVGDVVYLFTPKIKVNTSKKLAKLNDGPFRVISKPSPVIFEIKHMSKPENTQTVHLNRIFKVPDRTTFEWETKNTETQTASDPNAAVGECLPTEEEILKEYPPYALPLNPSDFCEDDENPGGALNVGQSQISENQTVNLESDWEGLPFYEEPGEIILIPANSGQNQIPIGEQVIEIQSSANDLSEDINDATDQH